MSLIAQAFDAVLKQYQDTDHLTMEDLFGHMEPAFAAEGYREPVSAQPQRILIVRLDEIGDCVLMIPMLRELRRAYPRAQIDLVVKSGPYPLMELCPYVNHVFVAEKLPRPGRPMREFFYWDRTFCEAHLWEQHYDLCLVPRWDIDETGAIVLAYFCGARQRIGFSEKCSPVKAEQDQGMNMLFTRPILTPLHVVHEVDKGLFLLRAGLGIRSERDDLEIWYRKSDADAAKQLLESGDVHGPYIAVAVGTREGRKTYPPELLAKALTEVQYGMPFVLLGGPGEEAAGAKIAKVLQKAHVSVLDLVGKTPLCQSTALVAMARLYMGGDTGLTHIAAAARRPIVERVCHPLDLPVTVLSSVARFAPWQARVIQVRPAHGAPGCEHLVPGFHEVAGCRSLYKPHCIQGIPPAQIAAAANQLLRRR